MNKLIKRGLWAALAVILIQSASAQITNGFFLQGAVRRDLYLNRVRSLVSTSNATQNATLAAVGQDRIDYLYAWEFPDTTDIQAGGIDNYADRMSGFFTPPTTGNYVFFVASDDDTDLYVSSNADPANKVKVASEPNWNGYRSWITVGSPNAAGRATANINRSDLLFPAGIAMTAGTRYYLESDHHEGGGGDNEGVTYKLLSDPDPLNSDPSKLTGAVIGTFMPTTAKIVQQPTGSGRYLAGSGLTLRSYVDPGLATNTTTVQWYKNDVAVPGATNFVQVIGPFTKQADDNSVYYAKITSGSQVLQTTNVIVTIGQIVYSYGQARVDRYSSSTQSKAAVEGGTAGTSGLTYFITSWHTGNDNIPNYTEDVTGYFLPDTTGSYVFFLAADDDTDLFLSTDDQPVNKLLIANEPGWSGDFAWTGAGGAGRNAAAPENRSDNGQYPFGVQLTKGSRYYMEAVHHQGGGGDDFGVTYKFFSDPDPVNGTPSRLSGFLIAANVLDGADVRITNNPASVSILENSSATLKVGVVSTNAAVITYQWLLNKVPIALANTATYTTPTLKFGQDGDYSVALLYAGGIQTSQVAHVTILKDTVIPKVLSAGYTTNNTIGVEFSKPISLADASIGANYSISGAGAPTILSVTTFPTNDSSRVILNVSGAPAAGATISVTGIRDISSAQNPIATTTVPIQISPFTGQDLGTPDVANPGKFTDPLVPGADFYYGNGDIDITAGGHDVYDAADGMHYVWEQKTGNFDVQTKVVNIEHVDQWSKATFMVRNDLTGPSITFHMDVDPAAGYNSYENNARLSTGGSTVAWPTVDGRATGVLAIPVTFPNAWIRLTRTNQILTCYLATNGAAQPTLADWRSGGVADLTASASSNQLAGTVYVGVGATAHNNNGTTTNHVRFASFGDTPQISGGPIVLGRITAKRTGNSVTLTWVDVGASLQSADTIKGPWTTVAGSSATLTTTVTATGTQKYYRLTK